jgi:folate-binding protein YgfZ
MSAGYDALRASAAWLDLSTRGRIYATGGDSARLLHAMTTNHVQQLQPGRGCYAFFLNAQGHILADVNLLRLEDRFLLDTEPETRELVYRHLDKYIIADDVVLEDVSAALACLAVEGPNASAVLAAVGAPVPDADYAHAAWSGGIIERASSTGQPGFRIFVPVQAKAEWIGRLESVGAVPATLDEARTVRLEQGKPRYGDDICNTTLPQETRQTDAVNFAKGCYLGQEIVERIRSRGHVNRLLVKLEIEGEEQLPNGAEIEAEGKESGEVSSSAFSPGLGKTVALAYVRAQYAAAGTVLSVAGRAAIIR